MLYLPDLLQNRRLILTLRRPNLMFLNNTLRDLLPAHPQEPSSPRITLLETKPRMENIQRQHRSRDDRTLQTNKILLRLDQMTVPALTQLRNTIHRASKNAQRRERQRDQKAAEALTRAQDSVCVIERRRAHRSISTNSSKSKVCRQRHEDEQSDDLES